MDDGWRVCIAFGVLPRSLHSFRQALICALGSRLGDQVTVSSSRWGTRIFLYAPSAGSADEAAQVAREVLARHDVSAPVRTEVWSPRDQEWRDAAADPSADPAAERQALYEARQERERQASVTSGRPAREVWVELPSHDDVVALGGYLAAQGWRVRPHRRHLIVGADCEDDAKSLARELCGDGRADADAAFRVRRVDIYASWTDGGAFSGGGP
jgi:hypothetical protein